MLSFGLYDLHTGGQLAELADREAASVAGGVNEGSGSGVQRKCELTLSFEDPAVVAHHDRLLRYPQSIVVRGWEDDDPIFAGQLDGDPAFDYAARTVTLNASCPSARLSAFQIGQRGGPAGDTDGLFGHATGKLYRLEGAEQASILWRLANYCYPTSDEQDAGVPGTGLIAGVLPDSITRDREYELGKNVWEAMVDLSQVDGGPDFDIRPVWDPDTPTVLAALDLYYPYMGSDRGVRGLLAWQTDENNCSSLKVSSLASQTANRYSVQGQALEGAPPLVVTRDNPAAMSELGIWAGYEASPDIMFTSTLAEHANAEVSARGYPPLLVEVTPAQDDDRGAYRDAEGTLKMRPGNYGNPPKFAPSGDYWQGDLVRVLGHDPDLGLLDEYVRVVGWKLTDDQGLATVAELTTVTLTDAADG